MRLLESLRGRGGRVCSIPSGLSARLRRATPTVNDCAPRLLSQVSGLFLWGKDRWLSVAVCSVKRLNYWGLGLKQAHGKTLFQLLHHERWQISSALAGGA
jgi:hypothetical protein